MEDLRDYTSQGLLEEMILEAESAEIWLDPRNLPRGVDIAKAQLESIQKYGYELARRLGYQLFA